MIKSGITRRIDELGRIVVPKEIRFNLGIREGDSLEIFTKDNAIVIKKYSEIENIFELSNKLCKIFYDIWGLSIIITDRDKVIACSGNLNIQEKPLPNNLKKMIDNRESIFNKYDKFFEIEGYFTILPIIVASSVTGFVIVNSNKNNEDNVMNAKIIQKIICEKIDVL